MRGECSSSNGGGIGVSSKASVDDGKFLVVELGLKLEQDDGHNQKLDGDPPFLSDQSGSDGARVTFDKLGTAYLSEIRDGDAAATAPAVTASSVGSGGDGGGDGSVAAVRSPLQPFDNSNTGYCYFESPGRMATTLRFPFTAAQWKELHRQAMIYKYMVASVPVPHDLLFPSPTNFSDPSATTSSWGKVSMLNLRWTGKNSKDAEPGRCKRTDGKKWRCSRDVAPNQKYCERHLNRGRPRSRKPVEIRADFSFNPGKISDAKKSRLIDSQNSAINGSTSASQCLGVGSSVQRFIRNHEKAPFEPMVSTATTFGAPRFSDWVIKEKDGSEQQWQQLELKDIGLEKQASFCKANPSVFQHHLEDQPPKVSSSSLASSMADSNHLIDDEICRIHMGLGVIDSDFNNEDDMKNQVSISSWLSPASWVPSNPGGPLAEVLGHHPTTVPDSDPSSSAAGNGYLVTPPATVTSSPSGVLQNTIASLSDSSGSNSPIFLRI